MFSSLKGLFATLLASGRTRLELLAVEVEEEKLRAIDLLGSTLAALFLLGLGIVLAVACLTAAFWEQRVLILGIAAGVAVAAGFLFASRAKARASLPSALFQTSIKELDKDLSALRGRSVGQP